MSFTDQIVPCAELIQVCSSLSSFLADLDRIKQFGISPEQCETGWFDLQ